MRGIYGYRVLEEGEGGGRVVGRDADVHVLEGEGGAEPAVGEDAAYVVVVKPEDLELVEEPGVDWAEELERREEVAVRDGAQRIVEVVVALPQQF